MTSVRIKILVDITIKICYFEGHKEEKTMFFLMKKSREAFARARAHEQDKRVLVVSNPEDLAAINLPGIKAVIWERDTRDITKALQEDKTGCAPTITQDAKQLKRIFRRATGCWWPESRMTEHTVSRPHKDSVPKRMVTVYSTNPQSGTLWYPGDLSDQDEERIRSASPPNVAAVAKEYRRQHVTPGHVMIMKGRIGNPREEQLLHQGQDARDRIIYIVNNAQPIIQSIYGS